MTPQCKWGRSRSAVLSLLLCTVLASPVAAEAQSAPDTANVISVRPSGFDARTEEARMAQERLERRLKRSDQAMRAICVGCGSRDAVPGAAPFSPIDALRAPPGAASQMLLPHALPDQVIVEIREVPVAGPELLVTEPAAPPTAPVPAEPSR
jgi:hypothetical protein